MDVTINPFRYISALDHECGILILNHWYRVLAHYSGCRVYDPNKVKYGIVSKKTRCIVELLYGISLRHDAMYLCYDAIYAVNAVI